MEEMGIWFTISRVMLLDTDGMGIEWISIFFILGLMRENEKKP
jgi:hypothetical protein